MSVKKEYDYPLAPLTVTTHNGRNLDFEVNRDGHIEITAEVPDYGDWGVPCTTEVSFWIACEDWRAVVEHIESDLGSPERTHGGTR